MPRNQSMVETSRWSATDSEFALDSDMAVEQIARLIQNDVLKHCTMQRAYSPSSFPKSLG